MHTSTFSTPKIYCNHYCILFYYRKNKQPSLQRNTSIHEVVDVCSNQSILQLIIVTLCLICKKNISILSKNCAGQKKIVLDTIYLVSTGWYENVDCQFLVSGHIFKSCDPNFLVIEKKRM